MIYAPQRLKDQTPIGLIGMIALVVAVETCVFRDNPAHTSIHAASWRFVERQSRRAGAGADVLCFGDSLVQFGLYPPVLESVTGTHAYNFALQSGPTPAAYFVLRRVLGRRRTKPRAAIIDTGEGVLDQGPRSTKRPYPWADFLSLTEAAELSLTTRDPDLFVRIVVDKALHSRKNRHEIRADFNCALHGETGFLRKYGRGFSLHWARNRGAQVNPKHDFQEPAYPPSGQRIGTWAADPINRLYLEKFLDLAAMRGVTVFWLLPPLHPVYHAHSRFRGDEALFTEFVRDVRNRHPEVVVIDGRDAGYDRTVYIDEAHLDAEGATALSQNLGRLVNAYNANPRDFPCWVRLPDYRSPQLMPLENILDSCAIAARPRPVLR